MAGPRQEPFNKLVAHLFREREKNPHLTVALLRQHWPAILGAELAGKTYPARVTRATLWVNAVDASWAYQLQFMKGEILHSIQVFTESTAVRDVRFRQGEVPEPTPQQAIHEQVMEAGGAGEASVSSAAPHSHKDSHTPPETSQETSPEPDAGPDTISDPTLRSAFARWRSGNRRGKTTDGS